MDLQQGNATVAPAHARQAQANGRQAQTAFAPAHGRQAQGTPSSAAPAAPTRPRASKIVASHIDKAYEAAKGKGTLAVHDVSLEIREGEFVCIVGPSGCGKSTILRMLAGLDFPTAGTITLDGRVIEGPGPDRGMVFQTYTLFPWMSVEDNIKFGPKNKGLPAAEQQALADRYLKVIGLEQFARAYPKELSGGMKQRVAIARALANKPEVLLMDEPFGALDPHTKSMMQLLMRQIWEAERPTVVFITHDIEEAVYLASSVYVMSAHPGTVIERVEVPLPEHRELSLRDAPEFVALRRTLNDLLYAGDDAIAGGDPCPDGAR